MFFFDVTMSRAEKPPIGILFMYGETNKVEVFLTRNDTTQLGWVTFLLITWK